MNPEEFTFKSEGNLQALKTYVSDLVAEAAGKLHPVIGRTEQIRRVLEILSRLNKNNPVLVGEPGVRKTDVVEGLAQRIAHWDELPMNLQNVRLLALNMEALWAGHSYTTEFGNRFQSVLKELKEAQGKFILFIDEIHLVLSADYTQKSMYSAANLFKSMLKEGHLMCIGATTMENYEVDAAFDTLFQKVDVPELSVEETISMLRVCKGDYEKHHHVIITDEAVVAAVQLSSRHFKERHFPDKAFDIIDDACAHIRVQLDTQPEKIDTLERKIDQVKYELDVLRKEGVQAKEARLVHELQLLEMKHRKAKEKMDKIQQLMQEHKEVLCTVDEDLQAMEDKIATMEAEVWPSSTISKDCLKEIQQLKRKRDELLFILAKREHSKAPITDNRYETLQGIKAAIAKHEADMGGNPMLLTETVEPEHIAVVVSRQRNIPVARLCQDEKERLIGLADRLHEKVIGQDEAVQAVAEAVLRSRAGCGRPQQPIGSFLFLGPTGVGKTELAKALAAQLFDQEEKLVRIDMSEYKQEHSVLRLIGAPPSYVGYERGGQLTEAVRREPYSVVLFDEVEKAHDSVLNILLQMLDDGRLTDGHGRTVSFSDTVIISTSNLGAEHLIAALSSHTKIENAREKVMQVVKRHFRPELFNRFDEIVIFDPLSNKQLRKIAELLMKDVKFRFAEKAVGLEVTAAALNLVLKKAHDPGYGARPLRRWIEKNIVTKLCQMLLCGEMDKNSTVNIDACPRRQILSYRVERSKENLVDTVTVDTVTNSVNPEAFQQYRKRKLDI